MSGNNQKEASLVEILVYGMGDVGANFCWSFMAAYITMYYTDSVGISGAVAGTIMLVARIFDGISDVLFAALIDRCHMKLGKIRPWFLISAPLLGVGLYASYHVPQGLADQAKIIYVFVTYTFVAAVAFTIYNLAYSAILPLMTLDEGNRNVVATAGRFFTLGGIAILNYVTPLLLAMWGGERSKGAWDTISLVYAIICTVLVAMMGISIKEKELPKNEMLESQKGDEQGKEKGSFMENLKIILSTKYTWLLIVLFLVFYFINSVYAIRAYYYRDVLGDLNFFSVGAMLAYLPSLFVLPFVPYLFKVIDRRKAIMFGMGIYVVITVVWTVMPKSVTVAYICTAMMAASWTPLMTAMFIYIADIADYIWLRQKKHVEHVVAMTSSIGTKIGTGLGSAVVGWGLSWCQYDGAKEIQDSVTQSGIVTLTTAIPLICAVFILVIVFFWDIDKVKEKYRLAEK